MESVFQAFCESGGAALLILSARRIHSASYHRRKMQGPHEGGGAFIYRVQRQGVPCGIPAGDRIPFHGAVLCDHVILLYEWCEEAEDFFYQGITSGYVKIFSGV